MVGPGNVILLSDFGGAVPDHAVSAMEAVIDRISPKTKVKSMCHDVTPFEPSNIVEGAFLLLTGLSDHAPGTIFLCVIDPGVGTDRNMLLAESHGYYFIGPDNGLLWPALTALGTTEERSIVALDGGMIRNKALEITKDPYFKRSPSDTFHGRDFFAVAAGNLASSFVKPENMGEFITDESELVTLSLAPQHENGRLVAPIVSIDRWGNCQVACTMKDFSEFVGSRQFVITVDNYNEELFLGQGNIIYEITENYTNAPIGKLIALFGGNFNHPTDGSFLEIALPNGNAQKFLGGIERGAKVTITLE